LFITLHQKFTLFQNLIEGGYSESFNLAFDVLQGIDDASNVPLPSTANKKEIPLGSSGNYLQKPPLPSVNTYNAKTFLPFAAMTDPGDFVKKSRESWSDSDMVDWIINGPFVKQMDNSSSHPPSLLSSNVEECATILSMDTAAPEQASCNAIANSAHTYLPSGHTNAIGKICSICINSIHVLCRAKNFSLKHSVCS
jgi:hypothetical protein